MSKLIHGKYGMGWLPDVPDFRDKKYSDYLLQRPMAVKLSPLVDLTPQCPPVYDQGQLGSCVSNGTAAAHQFVQIKEKFLKKKISSRNIPKKER